MDAIVRRKTRFVYPVSRHRFLLRVMPDIYLTVVEAIYDIHPYEEPVIYVAAVTRTLHVRYMDEDNPNRFRNNASEDWVPKEHRDQT